MNIATVIAVTFLGAIVMTAVICLTVVLVHGQAPAEGVLTVFSTAIGTAIGALGGWLGQKLTNNGAK